MIFHILAYVVMIAGVWLSTKLLHMPWVIPIFGLAATFAMIEVSARLSARHAATPARGTAAASREDNLIQMGWAVVLAVMGIAVLGLAWHDAAILARLPSWMHAGALYAAGAILGLAAWLLKFAFRLEAK